MQALVAWLVEVLLLVSFMFTSRPGVVSEDTTMAPVPVNRTIAPLTINMALMLPLSNKGHGKLMGGAFFVALEDLDKEAKRDNLSVTFTHNLTDTENTEVTAMKKMSDLQYKGNVSAFIGPSDFCDSAALMSTAFEKPYFTYNCPDQQTKNAGFYMMINAQTRMYYTPRFMVAVMETFQWTSFAIVHGTSFKSMALADSLKAVAKDKNIIVNKVIENKNCDTYIPFHMDKEIFRETLIKSKDATRVYVFLGAFESLILFLRDMQELGMTDTGRYAVIAVKDMVGKADHFFLTELERSHGKQMTRHLRAFRNVVLLQSAKKLQEQKEFEKRVHEKNSQYFVTQSRPAFMVPMAIQPEAYQLYDATMFYGRAVMSLMKEPDGDPENATQIIACVRDHTQISIQSGETFINSQGESMGSYTTIGVQLKDGEPFMTNGTYALRQTGYFLTDTPDMKYILESPPWWAKQRPSSDWVVTKADETDVLVYVIVGVAVFVAIATAMVIAGLWLRHYMYEKKLDRLMWKIEHDEIHLMNPGQLKEMMTPARPRKKDSIVATSQFRELLYPEDTEDLITEGSCDDLVLPVGVYRGTNIVVKTLTRHVTLTRTLKKQFQLRKELSHENVNRFIGACFEPPQVFIITQYCPRGSLQYILKDETSPLDDVFITSLVKDLIRGMSFIHESEFLCHGNLKSSNCLVDSRWTLKITDFGLPALGPPPRALVEDEDMCRGLLWTAPELLSGRRYRGGSNHHHHHNSHSVSPLGTSLRSNSSHERQLYCTQSGDVYSFAIILYELYAKSGPWGDMDLTCREIIDKLTSQAHSSLLPDERPFRPDVSSLLSKNQCKVILDLIQVCWDNDPDQRPDFKSISARFKPVQQGHLKSNIFDNMLAMMEKYAKNLEVVVAERTEQLRLEKKLTENLLLRMLPRSVAEKLKRGHRVEPEQYEQVSIYFSDIVGFTELSAGSTPMEVVDLLNELYTCFDSIIEGFDVYKVETIGDAYMVVSGLPGRNGDRHAGEVASMSLLLLEAIKEKRFRIRGSTEDVLKIRIGIHSGPCCAGVVGLKMPRYCLFGDTVNTASRLESTGEALKIHCSAECKAILDKLGGYYLQERGYIEMKGKGSLLTFFLQSEDLAHRQNRISRYHQLGSGARCVSASNLDYSGKIYSIGQRNNTHLQMLSAAGVGPGIRHRTYSPGALPHHSRLPTDRHSAGSFESTWSEPLPCSSAVQSQPRLDVVGHPPYEMRPPGQNKLSSSSFSHSYHRPDLTVLTCNNDFSSSTLPRTSVKQRNSSMSPIAEDKPGETSPLEKTFSFPENSIHSDTANSESDSLLMSTSLTPSPDGPNTNHNNNSIHNNRRYSNWTPMTTMKKTSIDSGTVLCHSRSVDESENLINSGELDSSLPETVF